MKVRVCFRTAGTVDHAEFIGHRITCQLQKSGRAKVTVYDEKGRIVQDAIYRKAEWIERSFGEGS